MPTSPAPDSSDRPTSNDSRSTSPAQCPECGAGLSKGACPACALGFLLDGGPVDEAALERRVEENVEFGRYTLKHKLAAGGMGVVYVAEDRKLRRTVALKMIRGSTFADEGEVARFTLEAEAAAGLDHPHIVPIYEVGRLDGQPFFTMKLIEGQTLAQRLKEHGGTLPAREVAVLLSKIARAVQHAHQRGVLHRDLKPGNILLDAEGTPWLTDFGLAKLVTNETSLTLTRDHIGTPHYMAPEVAGGNARAVSTASDVWALGVMLWEMLCGMPPFHGPGPVEIMRRIVESEPNWPAGSRADGDLVTIARRCMEKNPARRPQSAGEVADELDRWLRGEPIKARPVTRSERFIKWVRREPAMAALYAVLLVALFTGLVLWNRAERAVVSLKDTNERMEESLRIATATKLAGDARLQVDENPSRALLLAVESAAMMAHSGVLPESAAALTDVLQRTGGLDATPGGLRSSYIESWIFAGRIERESAQASPDGRWLMSVDYTDYDTAGPLAAIYDLHDPERTEPLRRWKLSGRCTAGERSLTWRWMPDSRRIVIVDDLLQVSYQEVIAPGMESGQTVTGPPPSQSPGTLAREGMTGTAHLCQTTGGEFLALCHYWQATEGGRVTSHLAQWKLTPEALSPGPLRRLVPDYSQPARLYHSPDGRRVIYFGQEDESPAWLIHTDRPEKPPVRLAGPAQPYAAVFNQDGRRTAIRCRDNSVWTFELPEPEATVTEVPGHRQTNLPGNNEEVAFSPDGKWLAVTGDSGAVHLQPLREGLSPVRLPSSGRLIALQFSADGRWLAAGGTMRSVNLWLMDDLETTREPQQLRGSPSYITGISFSKNNRSIIATSSGWATRRWPFDSVNGAAQPRHFQAGMSYVQDIAVSPDNEWIAAACGAAPLNGRQQEAGFVTLSRIGSRSYNILGTHANRACAVAFSRSGRWLASTGHDQTVKVWDFPALTKALEADGGSAPPPRFVLPVPVRPNHRFSLTFHPGDGCLYQVNGDGVLFAWDLSYDDPDATHQEERIHTRGYLLPDVAVSPDGRWLAVARHAWDKAEPDSPQCGNQVLLFDVKLYSWRPRFVMALTAGFLEETNLAFSPDSRWLAAGGTGSGASVWDMKAPDIASSRRISNVSAQFVPAVGFSPDGRYLAVGGNDGLLHLWNWQNPLDTRVIPTGAAINTLAWLPDGRLATAGGSSRIALWETDITRLKALARRVAGRELSDSERERFRLQGH